MKNIFKDLNHPIHLDMIQTAPVNLYTDPIFMNGEYLLLYQAACCVSPEAAIMAPASVV